jgi:hypothetical protein
MSAPRSDRTSTPRRAHTGGTTARRRTGTWTAPLLAAAALVAALVVSVPATEGAFTASVVDPTGKATTAADFTQHSLPYRDTWAGGKAGWTAYNGCWNAGTDSTYGYGTMSETCGTSTNGPKSLTGDTSWADYTVQSDVKIDSGTQAGLVLRVTSPTAGTNGLNGYYVGLNVGDGTNKGTVSFGRMDGGNWTLLGTSNPIATNIVLHQWYRLVVQAVGCTFVVTESTPGSYNTYPTTTFTDPSSSGCYTSGQVGVRDFSSTASWRYFTTSAGGTTTTTQLPYNAPFATGSTNGSQPGGYTTYGGTWAADSGTQTYRDATDGSGEKSVDSTTTWTDLTLTGDVQLTPTSLQNAGNTVPATPSGGQDAGFNVHVTNPSTGTDALNGYYAGIGASTLVLGRQDGSWHPVTAVSLGRTVQWNEWWHLTIEVVGCTVTATAQPTAGGAIVTSTMTVANCTDTSGAIGVRVHTVSANFRDLAVTPR